MDVKSLRESIGLTQNELAELTDIPRDRIAKWEQGKGNPKNNDAVVLNMLESRVERIKNKYLEIEDDQYVIRLLKYGMEVRKKRVGLNLTYKQAGDLLSVDPLEIELCERGLANTQDETVKKVFAWAGVDVKSLPTYKQLGISSHKPVILPGGSLDLANNPRDSETAMGVISKLVDQAERLARSNETLVMTNEKLVNKLLTSSGGPSSTSSSSKMKGKVSTDPTEEMQPGTQEKNSEVKRKRKDSVQH